METGPINPMALSLAASLSSTQQAEQVSEKREIVQAVRAINGAELLGRDQELTFAVDRDTRRPVVKVVDRNTGEVLMQVPTEDVLRLARQLGR
jgi:flagellar protein FlaG